MPSSLPLQHTSARNRSVCTEYPGMSRFRWAFLLDSSDCASNCPHWLWIVYATAGTLHSHVASTQDHCPPGRHKLNYLLIVLLWNNWVTSTHLVRAQNFDPIDPIILRLGSQIPHVITDGHIEAQFIEFMGLERSRGMRLEDEARNVYYTAAVRFWIWLEVNWESFAAQIKYLHQQRPQSVQIFTPHAVLTHLLVAYGILWKLSGW